jgi:uncharacterized protein (DUF2237 family)
MTAGFLAFSKSRGNDLSTPVPALEANNAPRVVLRATHEGALTYCALADLKQLAVDLAQSATSKLN